MNKTETLWALANPHRFIRLTNALLPFVWASSLILLVVGLVWGFAFTPLDFKQGSTVKIIFLHVPTALMAINVWLMMLAASLIWYIRRHHVSALAAKAAAPVGAMMAVAAIATGALWGEPMWGTWWAWDPRLTSFFILLLCYVGYIALWSTFEDAEWAADATAGLCLLGSVFALLSRYAVNFWNQGLHQGATLSLDPETNIHNDFYLPLLVSIAGFVLLSIALILYRTRTEIRRRRIEQLLAAKQQA
ncbi:MAG: heme ABC transporter permease CcmC [Rhodobacteraceae bacterium]|nr:heme ABC transporter permease CcmC [Paracoccaceae bacterium]MCY4197390.1 heme ABC transporter permease CcmC [Paracoccaceae bacterium]